MIDLLRGQEQDKPHGYFRGRSPDIAGSVWVTTFRKEDGMESIVRSMYSGLVCGFVCLAVAQSCCTCRKQVF